MDERERSRKQGDTRYHNIEGNNSIAAKGVDKRGLGGDHTRSEADNQGEDNTRRVKDPRTEPTYEEDRDKTIACLEKVLNMIKNNEVVVFGTQTCPLVVRVGKGVVKNTGMNMIRVNYGTVE